MYILACGINGVGTFVSVNRHIGVQTFKTNYHAITLYHAHPINEKTDRRKNFSNRIILLKVKAPYQSALYFMVNHITQERITRFNKNL